MKQASFIVMLVSVVFLSSYSQNKKWTVDEHINSLLNESNNCRLKSLNYTCAESYAQQALEASIHKKNAVGQFYAHQLLGYTARDQSNYSLSIEELNKAIKFIYSEKSTNTEHSFLEAHINCYTALSEIYLKNHDFENAQKNALEALELSEKYNLNKGQCWIALSLLFMQQKNIVQAKKYAVKAFNQFKLEKKPNEYARTLAYLANYAYQQAMLDSSIYYYQQSLDAYTKAENNYGQRICLFNLANLNMELGNFNQADSIAWQAQLKFDSTDVIGLYHINELRAILNSKAKEYGNAKTFVDIALDYAKKDKSISKLIDAYKIKREIELKLGNLDTCYAISLEIEKLTEDNFKTEVAKNSQKLVSEFELKIKEKETENNRIVSRLAELKYKNNLLQNTQLNQLNQLKTDSLYKVSLEKKLLENRAKFQQKNLENEKASKDQLLRENFLLQQQGKYETIIKFLLFIALITAVLIIYFIKRNLNNQKHINKLLEHQKNSLDINIKEINHRIKNNLQLISSLLSIQSRKITDIEQLELINNTKNRIESIALVHNQLAYSENTATVNCTDFFTSIITSITIQFNLNAHQINCKYDLDQDRTLNANSAVLIGMLLNELLTNYGKYVLKDVTQKVEIHFYEKPENNFEIHLIDTGVSFNPFLVEKSNTGIGLKLIQLLVEQANIKVQYKYSDANNIYITV